MHADWSLLNFGDPTDAVETLNTKLLELMKENIPSRVSLILKSSHPWINERCKTAIRAKNRAEGTERYEGDAKRCMEVIGEEYARFLSATRFKTLTTATKLHTLVEVDQNASRQ